MAKQGQIAGVGIAHRGDTEYLKSIPIRYNKLRKFKKAKE